MVVTELTDAELLDRARQGDEAAFTALYRRHYPAVHRLATSYRHGGEADDLVDATFAEVVAHLRRRSGPTEAFRAYLFATVHGRAVAAGSEAGAGAEVGGGPGDGHGSAAGDSATGASAAGDTAAGDTAAEDSAAGGPGPAAPGGAPARTIAIAPPSGAEAGETPVRPAARTIIDADARPAPPPASGGTGAAAAGTTPDAPTRGASAAPAPTPDAPGAGAAPGTTGPVPTSDAAAAPAARPDAVIVPATTIPGPAAGGAHRTARSTTAPSAEPEWPAVPEPVAAVAHYPALGGADRVMITRAFESLPDRWQVPLWHTVVLGGDAADLARALGVTTSVAAPIARYAAGKLRQAYLQAHLDAAPRPACEPHRARLAAHRRGALDAEAADGVRDHLSRCDSCRDLVAALDTVEELLARLVVPYFPTPAGRSGVPRPLGVSGQLAVVEVTGDPPAADRRPRRSGAYATGPTVVARPSSSGGTGSGAGTDGGVGDGHNDDERDGGPWGGGLAPRLGGAAAATVLVAALAVVGTAMTRDDGGPSPLDPVGGEPLSPGGGSGVVDRGSDDQRPPAPQDEEDAPTTTVPDDERAAADEDEDDDADDARPASPAAATRPDGDRPPRPSTPSGEAPSPGRPTPTTTTPTTEPPPDPDPELASWQVGWSAGSATGGTLTATVSSASGSGPVETAPVQLTIELSGGAHVGSLDASCQASGQTVTCTVPAPAAGGRTSVSIGVTVDGPDESAMVSAHQAGAPLGSQRVALAVDAVEAAEVEA
ncbi:MAG TPA: sigma factor [Acidimicrobiales bacterium]